MKQGLAAVLLACVVGAPMAASPPPDDSIYRLPMAFTDQAGQAAALDRYRGAPVLVSMFYGSCPHVCPMLVATAQRMERELPDASRGRLRVLMVSIDPERDTPARLAELARRHNADLSRWTFAHAGAADVRRLAAVLNIQYRQRPDGEFNHSTVISLLDVDGRIVKQTSSMLRPDAEFLDALRAATAP